jgi:hypothetical protein
MCRNRHPKQHSVAADVAITGTRADQHRRSLRSGECYPAHGAIPAPGQGTGCVGARTKTLVVFSLMITGAPN